jgi:hypothetical protein
MRTFLKVWIGVALLAIGFGIAVVVLAVATGDYHKDIPTYSLNESYDGVKSIDMDINYGEVKIIEGNTFSIDAENLYDDMESYVSDGTWYISQENNGDFRIFGCNISLGSFGRWDEDFQPKITITIPEGFVAEDFTMNIEAGSVEADSISASQADFTVEAGRIYVNQISVSDKSVYNVGAGQMVLKDAVLKDITMESGVGSIVIEGKLTGDNDITCGVGKIELDLIGNESDFSYDINAGIGDVDIDGSSYHGVDQRIDNGTGKNLSLDCGIGNITVDFD